MENESIYSIISRKEAQEKGLTQYFTGKPCKRGHISPRNVQSCNCLECWREDNKVERTRARKLKQRNATPVWANLKSIQDVYIDCANTTKRTGIVHHVDHIVPINGEDVCGLHVHYNLRVIPANENAKKSNKLDESLILCG